MRTGKRLLSLLLCGAMLFSHYSMSAFAKAQTIQYSGQITADASGLCKYYIDEHTPDCSYDRGGQGELCTNEHTGDCYPEEAGSSVSGNDAAPSNAEEREPENCGHACSEDCGCSPAAEGTPCGICSAKDAAPSNEAAMAVGQVEGLIDALPTAEELSGMSEEEQNKVYNALQAAYDAYEALTDRQKEETMGAEIFESLFAFFGGMANLLEAKEVSIANITEGAVVITAAECGSNCPGHTITGTSNIYTVTVKSGTHDITLDGVNINVFDQKNVAAVSIEGTAKVNLTLKGENTLQSGEGCAGLQVPFNTELVITENSNGGSLNATGGAKGGGVGGGAGIGGFVGHNSGAITIEGGDVTATGNDGGAGIGGGYAGHNEGAITIEGGDVTAISNGNGAGIGNGGSNLNVGTFEANGNAFIVASSIADQSGKKGNKWSGVIFENTTGYLYGDSIILTTDAEIPKGSELTIKEGQTLTIGGGVTLNNEGTIHNNGTIKVKFGGALNGNNVGGIVKYLSNDTGVKEVWVDGTSGDIDGTKITVILPYGKDLPTDYSKIDITPTDENATASTPSSVDNGATWTFTVTAEDGSTKDYTINVSVAPDPAAESKAAIAAARSTIEAQSWTVEQSTANTKDMVMIWIENQLDQLAIMSLNGVDCTFSITDFTAATAGTSADKAGTNGSFTFTVSLSKGAGDTFAEDTVTDINGTVTATLYQAKDYTVSVSASPTEGGTASGGGIYAENTSVTVTATAQDGYHFVKWTEGDSMVSTSKDYTFTLTGNRTLTAVFEKDSDPAPPEPVKHTVTVQNDGNGTASASQTSAPQGEKITLTAKPSSGYHFKEWQVVSGDVTISSNSFTMPAQNVTVKAIFEKDGGASGGDGDPSTPTYGSNTLSNSGITLSGSDIHKDARLTVTPNKLHEGQCAECDQIRRWQEQGRVIAIYDVSLSYGFRGTVTLTFPVSSAYNGKTLTVVHCLKDKLDSCDVVVSNGQVTVTADGLSPFAILDNSKDEPGTDNPDAGTDNPDAGTDNPDAGTTWMNQTDKKSPMTGSSGISPWEITGLCALSAALFLGMAAVITKRRRKMKTRK